MTVSNWIVEPGISKTFWILKYLLSPVVHYLAGELRYFCLLTSGFSLSRHSLHQSLTVLCKRVTSWISLESLSYRHNLVVHACHSPFERSWARPICWHLCPVLTSCKSKTNDKQDWITFIPMMPSKANFRKIKPKEPQGTLRKYSK